MQWIDAPAQAFAEFHRVLRVGGLLTFTTLGPDTLRELRRAFGVVDAAVHVHRFLDMHDVGDLLVASGFADPVMDMEMITLTYPDATALMRELKDLGAHNATVGRPRALMGRARWATHARASSKLSGRMTGCLPRSKSCTAMRGSRSLGWPRTAARSFASALDEPRRFRPRP